MSEPGTDEPLELISRPEYRDPAPVAKSWERIESWLHQYLPNALATLRPPASESDLKALENRIQRTLPADFRESYLIHDGQDCHDEASFGLGVIFGCQIEPIEKGEGVLWLYEHRVFHKWPELENEMLDWTFFPPDAMRNAYSGPGWVPFYWDCGGRFIGIDLDPGPNGIVGQVIPFGYEDEFRPVLAISFAHLLEDIADELEAGHALIDSSPGSHAPFQLKDTRNGYFGNAYKEWAQAKLPLEFQNTKAAPRFVPEDHATPVNDELAARLIRVLLDFLTEMNRYERRWLAVRPIDQYRVTNITECGPKRKMSVVWGFDAPKAGDKLQNQVQKILWTGREREKKKVLEIGKYRREAAEEKRAIWNRFLTEAKRPYSNCFHQQVPLYYDPHSVIDPDVRQVSPGHVIITFGEPRREKMWHDTGRLRYHLRLVDNDWRIERHECVDNPAKPWKLDFL